MTVLSLSIAMECVNALKQACVISTATKSKPNTKSERVNALKRARVISTYPLRNPVFMRLPKPILTGNQQNILKKSIFGLFFGLT